MDKVFILTEEVELSNGVVEFDVIGVYAEEHVAQEVMEGLSFETNRDWSRLRYDISWYDIER